MNTKDKRKEFIQALKENGCNISTACNAVDIARQTHYDWLDKSDTYKKEYLAMLEGLKDFVETALLDNIIAGNVTAQIFWLKTKGKDRGYVEKVEIVDKTPADVITLYLPENGRNKVDP